jgi:hypothetical protein
MFSDIKITTEMLYQGALGFALMDAVYIPLLFWRVKGETFCRLKWPLVIAAALTWYGIWSWAIGNFWEDVYSYLFPAWAQTWIPRIVFIAAGFFALGLWTLSIRIKGKPVLIYCLLGGILGSITHIWAVYRGIVTKPPILQGASPLGAVVIAFFEYIFYWCVILTIATIMDWVRTKLERSSQNKKAPSSDGAFRTPQINLFPGSC